MARNLRLPVPDGGTSGNLVKMGEGSIVDDGPFTVIAVGSGDDGVIGKLATTGPATATQFGWVKIGVDTAGNTIYSPVWK